MSRSVEIIYKPYYRKFLSIFTKTLPKSYEKYTEITQTACDDTSYLEMERDFVKCVEFYSEEIFSFSVMFKFVNRVFNIK
jgi:hypothetical protein